MPSKTILMIIAPEQFRDEEFFVPYEHFLEQGYTCTVASPKVGIATGMLGGSFHVQCVLDETLNANDYDALSITGGMGSPQFLWNNKTLHALVQQFVAADKPTAAICLSGVVLANAGVLNGKKATVWACDESIKAFEDAGVTYSMDPVVVEGKLITADGPESVQAYTQAIERALNNKTASVT